MRQSVVVDPPGPSPLDPAHLDFCGRYLCSVLFGVGGRFRPHPFDIPGTPPSGQNPPRLHFAGFPPAHQLSARISETLFSFRSFSAFHGLPISRHLDTLAPAYKKRGTRILYLHAISCPQAQGLSHRFARQNIFICTSGVLIYSHAVISL